MSQEANELHPEDCKHEGQWEKLGMFNIPLAANQHGEVITRNVIVVSNLFCKKCGKIKIDIEPYLIPKEPKIVKPVILTDTSGLKKES